MSIFYIPVVFVVLFDLLYISYAITHWIVSKDDRIQAQHNSIYRLKRPYDLVAFLNQEKLAKNVASHIEKMLQRKKEMDKSWPGIGSAIDVEEELVSTDEDCILARNAPEDGDLYMNVIDYAPHDVYKEQKLPKDKDIKLNVNLDCRKFSKVDFSMKTFPHLQIMYHPWNLSWPKESEIVLPFTPKQIHYGLSANKTNWYLYNLASLYWRKKGDSQKAFHCIKRGIHFAPRRYKDTPLFNLGMMLHRAHCAAEAAIVLHGAVDHSPTKPFGHFVLANVYATLGDYDRSIACYSNVLGLDPTWHLAKYMRHTVICNQKLRLRLEELDRSIRDMLKKLKEFQILQEEWLKFHEEILRQQPPANKSFSVSLNTISENSLTPSCSGRKNDLEILSCDITPNFNFKGLKMDADLESLFELFSKVKSQALKITEKMKNPSHETTSDPSNKQNDENFIPFQWNSDFDDHKTFRTNDY